MKKPDHSTVVFATHTIKQLSEIVTGIINGRTEYMLVNEYNQAKALFSDFESHFLEREGVEFQLWLNEMQFDSRTRNLLRDNYQSLNDLLEALRSKQIIFIRHLGKKRIQKIIKKMREKGYEF